MHEKDSIAIEECLYAIAHIEEYVAGITSEDELLADSKTFDAVDELHHYW